MGTLGNSAAGLLPLYIGSDKRILVATTKSVSIKYTSRALKQRLTAVESNDTDYR